MKTRSKRGLKAIEVARYFIYLANLEKAQISNKKLQKLVYYSQAWSLVLRNKKLFSDPIEAWVHGPAVRVLYGQYKSFGFNPIKEDVSSENISNITGKIKIFLDQVWKLYGKLDARYLEALTHSELPWQEARNGIQGHESSKNEISLKIMKSYYTKKLEEAKKRHK